MPPDPRRLGQRPRRQPGGAILLGEETFEGLAENLLGSITLDARGAGIPAAHPTPRVEHDDAVVSHALDQALEPPLAFRHGGAALGDLPGEHRLGVPPLAEINRRDHQPGHPALRTA